MFTCCLLQGRLCTLGLYTIFIYFIQIKSALCTCKQQLSETVLYPLKKRTTEFTTKPSSSGKAAQWAAAEDCGWMNLRDGDVQERAPRLRYTFNNFALLLQLFCLCTELLKFITSSVNHGKEQSVKRDTVSLYRHKQANGKAQMCMHAQTQHCVWKQMQVHLAGFWLGDWGWRG